MALMVGHRATWTFRGVQHATNYQWNVDMTTPNPGDLLMRKGAEYFSEGKYQKAFESYGQAIQAYIQSPLPVPQERLALGFYTRAILILRGHVDGDVESNIDQGEKVMLGCQATTTPIERFRGLFLYLRGWTFRLTGKLEAAERALDDAKVILDGHGTTLDQMEVRREKTWLAIVRRDQVVALNEARAALSRAASPEQRIYGKILLADVHQAFGKSDAAEAVLAEALTIAQEHRLTVDCEKIKQRLHDVRQPETKNLPDHEPKRWV